MQIRKKYVIALLLAFGGLIVWLAKSNMSAYDYQEDAEDAASTILSVYLEEGMSGLIALSKECYEHDKIKPQVCFANDVASKVWDKGVTAAMKLPAEEYFEDENIIQRLLARDQGKMFTKADAVACIPKIEAVVEERLVIEWNLQKHKLDTAE